MASLHHLDFRLELPLGTRQFQRDSEQSELIRWEPPNNRFLLNVRSASLTFHLPAGRDTPRPLFLICPGGGYQGVSLDKEGHLVASWLNRHSIAGAVLKYRLPDPEHPHNPPLPWQDALLALGVIQQCATELALDLKNIGVLGFSAGAHLAGSIALRIDELNPDRTLPRPAFAALIYPVVTAVAPFAHTGSFQSLLGENVTPEVLASFSLEHHVQRDSPALFLFHARDDAGVPAANSEALHAAAQAAGADSTLSICENGGHGFGMGQSGTNAGTWPDLFLKWFGSRRRAHAS